MRAQQEGASVLRRDSLFWHLELGLGVRRGCRDTLSEPWARDFQAQGFHFQPAVVRWLYRVVVCLSFCLRDRDACEVIAYGGGSRKDSSELFNQACQHLTVVYERKLVVLPSLFWTSQGTVSIH